MHAGRNVRSRAGPTRSYSDAQGCLRYEPRDGALGILYLSHVFTGVTTKPRQTSVGSNSRVGSRAPRYSSDSCFTEPFKERQLAPQVVSQKFNNAVVSSSSEQRITQTSFRCVSNRDHRELSISHSAEDGHFSNVTSDAFFVVQGGACGSCAPFEYMDELGKLGSIADLGLSADVSENTFSLVGISVHGIGVLGGASHVDPGIGVSRIPSSCSRPRPPGCLRKTIRSVPLK